MKKKITENQKATKKYVFSELSCEFEKWNHYEGKRDVCGDFAKWKLLNQTFSTINSDKFAGDFYCTYHKNFLPWDAKIKRIYKKDIFFD